MVKYGDSGRAYRRQRGRHRPKREPIDAVSVFFFFLRPPSLLLRLFLSMKEIKNRLSTDSPCFGPLSTSVG